jgi:hypothetical protein
VYNPKSTILITADVSSPPSSSKTVHVLPNI